MTEKQGVTAADIIQLAKSKDVVDKLTSTSMSHIDRHQRSDPTVLNRVLNPSNNIWANSTFDVKSAVEESVCDSLMVHSEQIAAWLNNPYDTDNFAMNYRAEGIIGHGFVSDKRTEKIEEVKTQYVHVVLGKDPDSKCGFSLVTLYPDCDPRRVKTQKTGRDLNDLIKKTWEYQDGDDTE